MNRRIITGILAVLTSFTGWAGFQDFDGEGSESFKAPSPFELSREKAFSMPNSLKLPLGTVARKATIPMAAVSVKPGQLLGISLNYWTPSNFVPATLTIVGLDSDNRETEAINLTLPRTDGWGRLEEIVAVPNNPGMQSVILRLNIPAQSSVGNLYFDNVRTVALDKKADFEIEAFRLPEFDQWKGRSFEQERLLFDPNTRLFLDWHKSKFGESCVEMTGNNTPFQYPMRITNIKIVAGQSYELNFFYNTSASYSESMAMVIVFFRDAANNTLKEQARLPLGKTTDWREASLNIIPPPTAAYMDVTLRFFNIAPTEKIYINRIILDKGHPEVKIAYQIDPAAKILTGRIITHSIPVSQTKLTLFMENRNIPVTNDGEFKIDLVELPDTKITLTAEAAWADRKVSAQTFFHNFNQHPWENSTLGKLKDGDPAPFPWQNLRYDQQSRKVTTWNPQIEFSPTGALTQIELNVSKEKLLRSPVRLELNNEDIFTNYDSDTFKPVTTSPNYTSFAGQLRNRDFKINVDTRVEFDGMVKYVFDIQAVKDTEIKTLALKYAPAASDYMACVDGSWTTYDIGILRDRKHYETGRFYPILWTGKLEYGLYWCGERLFPEVEVQQKTCNTMNYGGDFTIMLVNAPLSLKAGQSHRFEYAFGSTPFRPATQDVPQWRFRAGKYTNSELLWPMRKIMPSFGFPKSPDDPAILENFLKSTAGQRIFVYQIPFYAMTNIPQYFYFEKLWKNQPERVYPAGDDSGYPYPFFLIDIANQSWQDLYLQNYKKYLTDNKFGGVYFDCVSVYANQTPAGNFSYRVFSVRDFLQRIYILQRQLNPDSWSIAHCGSAICDFNVLFSDILLTGEHYREQCMKYRYYLEFLTLEEFRIQNCTEFGPLRMFLPQFRGSKTQAPDIAVHTMGMILLHNQYPFPSFICEDIVEACRNRYYSFYDSGRNNRFVPYWKSCAIDSGNPSVPCSALVNDAGTLLIYLNATNRPQEFTLPANLTGDIQVYDPLKKQTDNAKPGQKITIEPYMMKMGLSGSPDIWKTIR